MRNKLFVTMALAVIASLLMLACSQDLSDAEIRERAGALGMVDRAEAEAMAKASAEGAAMSDMEVMARAGQLVGGMNEQELMAVATQMGILDRIGAAAPMTGDRLQQVRDRGMVVCASNNSLAGFGFIDEGGNTVGFDIDLCRAVAAAVLGDPDKVEYRATTAAERGPTMQSGEVDMMSRNTTWTTSRDATWGDFAQTMFYDGQGFMAPTSLGLTNLLELEGAKVCVQQGTTTELNLQDFNNQNNLNLDVVTFPDNPSTDAAYLAGQCDALTTDRSGLTAKRAGLDDPEAHTILPGTISEEPLGPVVPHGDAQWYDVVKAVMAMLIYAEAFEITSDNVPMSKTGDTAVDRLFGLEGSFGQEEMGLSATVAQDVIRAVGNYGEIYDRHLTPLGLTREGSRNALWSSAPCMDCPKGGQVYAAPLR